MPQVLPTEFNNTQAIWDNMPAFAAMQAGQNNRIALENNDALQAAYANEEAYKAQSRPVELANLVATGDRTRSGIRHDDAMTRESGKRSQLAEGTMAGNIKATNSGNASKVVANQVADALNNGELFGQIAAKIGDPKMPAFERVRIAKTMLGEYLPNHPEMEQALLMNADNLPQMFAQASEQSRKASAAYRSEQEKLKNAKDISGNSNATQIKLEEMRIEAGKYKKKDLAGSLNFEQNLFKLKKAHEKFAALTDAAEAAKEENPALAASYLARREELRAQAQAELQAAGAATVAQQPGQRPTLVNKGAQVDLGGNKPKLGTAENPIKLD